MNFEKFKNRIISKKESLKGISRRNFIKLLGIFTLFSFLPNSLKNFKQIQDPKQLEDDIEYTKEILFRENLEREFYERLIARNDWDKDFKEIEKQYKKKEGFVFYKNLEKLLKRIIIHHSEVITASGGEEEVISIKNYHTKTREQKLRDIGYHFLIGRDGKIYEGRPLDAMGAHAGFTKGMKKNRKLDPDYGSIGICLLGDFDQKDHKPTEEQIKSIKILLNKLLLDYDIPHNGIMGHRDIGEKVIKPSGLEGWQHKTCPGKNVDINIIKNDLHEETEKAKEKNILLNN